MKTNKILYQWDAGQKLTDCRGVFVDFVISGEVYRCDVVNGECIVPDELLQHPGNQTAYECMADNTLQEFVFSVVPRPLPPDYVYTPTEKLTFEGLVQKVEDTVADIIRRADTGEFDGYTPVKGKDYFTESEKNEMMQRVSDGAIGEFREVVDSATTEYNDNASEKLTTYDTNAEQHTSDYNRNAEVKLESYNQNHAAKVAEYNQNAETKTAEFDANAAALQTEVDRLRGECDQLAAENRKQENRIDALIKLNKGQTYDVLEQESEAYSVDVPSGAKYVGIDKVGGKSVVWNQLFNLIQNNSVNGGQFEINFESQTVTLNGNSGNNAWLSIIPDDDDFSALNVKNHQYIYKIAVLENQNAEDIRFGFLNRGFVANIPANYTGQVNFVCTVSDPDKGKSIGFSGLQPNTDYNVRIMVSAYDLTLMFGAGTEPTAEQFEQMFPAESYPYNPGEIISSRTETITAGVETITTGFPELKSAGTAHDVIDLDGGQVIRNVYTVEIETLQWRKNADNRFVANLPAKAKAAGTSNVKNNELCNTYESKTMNEIFAGEKGIATHPITGETVWIFDSAYETPEQLVASLAGAVLHYELATPTTEPVTIPEPLQEWLPVEAGGTVTFRNADDSKQLAVPNAVSWVRKLDEVN